MFLCIFAFTGATNTFPPPPLWRGLCYGKLLSVRIDGQSQTRLVYVYVYITYIIFLACFIHNITSNGVRSFTRIGRRSSTLKKFLHSRLFVEG